MNSAAITSSLLTTFGQNLRQVGIPSYAATLKSIHGFNKYRVYNMAFNNLIKKDPKVVFKFKFENIFREIEDLDKKLADDQFIKNHIKKFLGKKYVFEYTDNDVYHSYFKPIYKICRSDLEQTVRLRYLAKRSMKIMDLAYFYVMATVTGCSDLIRYDLSKEDREFMNAFAEGIAKNLHIMLFPGDSCPNIAEYICDNFRGKKWNKTHIVCNDAYAVFARNMRKVIGPYCDENGDLDIHINGVSPVPPKKGALHFSRPTGEHMYQTPIRFMEKGEKATVGFFGDIDKSNDKKVSEEVVKKHENKLVVPEPEDTVTVNYDIDEEPVKEEIKKPEEIKEAKTEEPVKKIYNNAEELLKDKFSDMDFTLRDENGITFVDVKKEDGSICSNIIDEGRYAGGKKFSVIGTALLPNNPALKYPQYIDIEKFPSVAKKILLDEYYHLTEEERVTVSTRTASPIVYEWFDFTNTEFINDLNDIDLQQFYYNCFRVITQIDKQHQFKVDARLRIINYVNISNFTIVSDTKCTSDYAKYGIKQNNMIIEGLRIEIRNGLIIDNSTRAQNNPAMNQNINPFANVPSTPLQMFNQISNNNITVSDTPISSGFIPANNDQFDRTYLPDGSFIPSFVAPSFGTYKVPELYQPLTNASSIIKRGMSYSEYKEFLKNPLLTEKTVTDLQKLYPEHTARYIKEYNRNSGNK